jgi:hypothetical protein
MGDKNRLASRIMIVLRIPRGMFASSAILSPRPVNRPYFCPPLSLARKPTNPWLRLSLPTQLNPTFAKFLAHFLLPFARYQIEAEKRGWPNKKGPHEDKEKTADLDATLFGTSWGQRFKIWR